MELLLFVIVTAVVLGGGVGVVLARNPVHSALFLVQSLLGVAVFFLVQEAQLLAAVQVIVYASAVVVLFVFVIMLLGVDRREFLEEPLKLQRPAAALVGAILLLEIFVLAGRTWATGQPSATRVLGRAQEGNIEQVARSLFTQFLWPFELVAVLLVIAVVGAVVLARRSGEGVPVDVDADAEGPA